MQSPIILSNSRKSVKIAIKSTMLIVMCVQCSWLLILLQPILVDLKDLVHAAKNGLTITIPMTPSLMVKSLFVKGLLSEKVVSNLDQAWIDGKFLITWRKEFSFYLHISCNISISNFCRQYELYMSARKIYAEFEQILNCKVVGELQKQTFKNSGHISRNKKWIQIHNFCGNRYTALFM